MFADHDFKRHSTSSSFETNATIADPAVPSDIPRKRPTNLGNTAARNIRLKKSTNSSSGFEVVNQSVPWDVEEVLSDQPTFARRVLAILAIFSILLVIFGLGLGLGLTNSADDSDHDEIEVQEPKSASDFLEAHALFHDVLFQIEDEVTLIADDNMQVQSISDPEFEFLPLASRYNLFTDFGMVRFFSGGETVRLNVTCKTIANTDDCAFVGVRFGLNGGSLRVMSSSNPIKITLPTDCAPETCAVVDLRVLGISADKETISSRPLYVRFGWTCEEESKTVSCESDYCFASFASCNAVASTWPDEERFQLCLEQFGFDDKLSRIVDFSKGNCFDLETLEASAEQCARLVEGINLAEIRMEERKKVNPSVACVTNEEICGGQLSCDSYVVSKRLQGTEHASPSPTSISQTTSRPTNSPTGGSSQGTGTPSVPTSTTRTPTTFGATWSPTSVPTSTNDTATCHPSCTCAEIDPCCCRDGFCAADTCPESFQTS